jgi:hypothetical protein
MAVRTESRQSPRLRTSVLAMVFSKRAWLSSPLVMANASNGLGAAITADLVAERVGDPHPFKAGFK